MKSETRTTEHEVLHQKLTRRRFLQATGVSGAALSLSGLMAACKSSSGGGGGGGGSSTTVKIGFVSPKTGSLAPVR